MAKKVKAIVKVNLEYEFEVNNPEEAIDYLFDTELPKEYVEDSFEILKLKDENGREIKNIILP